MVFGIPGSSEGSWRVSLRWSLTLWLSTPRKDSNVPKTEPRVLLRSPEVHLEDIQEVWQEKCWKAMENASQIFLFLMGYGRCSDGGCGATGWLLQMVDLTGTASKKHIPKTESNLHKFLSWFILIHCGSCGREQNARNSHAPPPEVPNPQPILEISENHLPKSVWYRGMC